MNKRSIILTAGCIIQTILGGIYAWSTFVPHLTADYISSGQCGFIFGTTILAFTSTMILAGRILEKKGAKFTAVISSILFMAGYLFASFSGGSFMLLLLSIGVITGAGIGFGYVCPLTVGMKWFPEKKGLVSGVAVAGFGAGAILLASIAEYFLVHHMDVLLFFRWLGIIAGIILFAAAMVLSEPPTTTCRNESSDSRPKIIGWPFMINLIGMFAGTFAGLLIIGNLTPIVMEEGLTEKQAVFAVSMFAVGNGIGRIIWGRLFDLFNYKSIPLSLIGLAVTAGALLLPLPNLALIAAMILIGFCFGANFVLYASAISKFFGVRSFPHIYPLCFMAYGIAGVFGPGMGGLIAEKTGSYHIPIYICIAIIAAAGILIHLKLPFFNKTIKSARIPKG